MNVTGLISSRVRGYHRFMPLNAIMFGINDTLRKSKNLSPLTMPVVKSSAIIPVENMAMMALTLLPLVKSWWYSALIPHREYPYTFGFNPLSCEEMWDWC